MTLGTESEYIPRDDESEAKRAAVAQGVGEELVYLDPSEINDYNINDFNLRYDDIPR